MARKLRIRTKHSTPLSRLESWLDVPAVYSCGKVIGAAPRAPRASSSASILRLSRWRPRTANSNASYKTSSHSSSSRSWLTGRSTPSTTTWRRRSRSPRASRGPLHPRRLALRPHMDIFLCQKDLLLLTDCAQVLTEAMQELTTVQDLLKARSQELPAMYPPTEESLESL